MNKRLMLPAIVTILLVSAIMSACVAPTPATVKEVVKETVVVEKEVEVTRQVETAPTKLIMSFVPSGDTQDIITGGEAIERLLEEKTGYEIDTNVATSYAAVIEAMCAENADIGWLNTFGYLVAHEKCGVDVILGTVRFGTPYYTGQIIVGADTGIESIADLKGKVMCWVDPLSTSGYIIPSLMLRAAGVDPDTDLADTVMAGSHTNVVTAVYNGDCDAGATYVDARGTVEDEFPDVMDKVVVIAESPEIPNDTVSVRPGLPDDVVQNVKQALLDIADTEEGQDALFTVYEIEDLQEVDDSFYDPFRLTLDAAGVNIEDFVE
jgi:phosphonate transport system substrate-binding protein